VRGLRLRVRGQPNGFAFKCTRRLYLPRFSCVTRVTLVLFPSGAKYPQYFAGAVATSAPDVI